MMREIAAWADMKLFIDSVRSPKRTGAAAPNVPANTDRPMPTTRTAG